MYGLNQLNFYIFKHPSYFNCSFFLPKTHYFALVSKPNTAKFNSNPQWDQYIQHGGTTPKPTKKLIKPPKLTQPISPTKLKQTPIYTISTHPDVLFILIYTYIFISHVQYWGPSAETIT